MEEANATNAVSGLRDIVLFHFCVFDKLCPEFLLLNLHPFIFCSSLVPSVGTHFLGWVNYVIDETQAVFQSNAPQLISSEILRKSFLIFGPQCPHL